MNFTDAKELSLWRIPTVWKILDENVKINLVIKWIDFHYKRKQWLEFVSSIHYNQSISLLRNFRSFIRFIKFNYREVVSWMLGYYDHLQEAIIIAKTPWLDN